MKAYNKSKRPKHTTKIRYKKFFGKYTRHSRTMINKIRCSDVVWDCVTRDLKVVEFKRPRIFWMFN